MKQGKDIATKFPGVIVIHQKIRGYTVDSHKHDYHEIFFPLQGEIKIKTGDSTLKAGVGKMIYLPPGVDHTFESSDKSQGERLILIIEDRIWRANQGGNFSALFVSSSQLCKELLFHLLIHPKTKAIKPLIQTLICTLSETFETAEVQKCINVTHLVGKSSDHRITKALNLISANFHLAITMDTLAKNSGMSTRNLNRLFLKELGVTPKQVVTLYRIEKAKELLLSRNCSVTDVALEVGYSSISQFITIFRRFTGRLPSDFNLDRH